MLIYITHIQTALRIHPKTTTILSTERIPVHLYVDATPKYEKLFEDSIELQNITPIFLDDPMHLVVSYPRELLAM